MRFISHIPLFRITDLKGNSQVYRIQNYSLSVQCPPADISQRPRQTSTPSHIFLPCSPELVSAMRGVIIFSQATISTKRRARPTCAGATRSSFNFRPRVSPLQNLFTGAPVSWWSAKRCAAWQYPCQRFQLWLNHGLMLPHAIFRHHTPILAC